MDTPIVIAWIIAGIIGIVNLVLFWRLCKDTHTLVLHFTKTKPQSNQENNEVSQKSTGLKSPGKTDVQEFKSRIKQFCKSNKDPKSQKEFIDSLIVEYNSVFNEDFSQYID